MLQGALTAVAAKAKEAKAAVGSAVGEIRDAIDNPTYDEHEDDAWSDEEADARDPRVDGRASTRGRRRGIRERRTGGGARGRRARGASRATRGGARAQKG